MNRQAELAKKGIGMPIEAKEERPNFPRRTETSAKIAKFGRKPPTKPHCARLVEESAL